MNTSININIHIHTILILISVSMRILVCFECMYQNMLDTCVFTHLNIYTHTLVCTHKSLCTSVYVDTQVIYVLYPFYTDIVTYISHICKYTHTHIYICIHTQTYTHIYIHTHKYNVDSTSSVIYWESGFQSEAGVAVSCTCWAADC